MRASLFMSIFSNALTNNRSSLLSSCKTTAETNSEMSMVPLSLRSQAAIIEATFVRSKPGGAMLGT